MLVRACVLVMVMAGCASRLLEGIPDLAAPSTASEDLASQPVDAAMQYVDAAMQTTDAALQQDAGACAMHTYVEVPLGAFGLLDGRLQSRMAFRFIVDVPGGPCDVPGPIDVVVQPGNATDFVGLTAHLWRSTSTDPACAATSSHFTRDVTLDANAPLSSPSLLVRDQAAGAVREATFAVANARGGPCLSAGPRMECNQDCDCAAGGGGRCVLEGEVGGVCLSPCSEDTDCVASGVGLSCADGQLAVRACGWFDDCVLRGACPFGQTCTGMNPPHCTPPPGDGIGRACSCDGDCALGGVCAPAGRCVMPCVTSNDCPAPLVCAGAAGCSPPV